LEKKDIRDSRATQVHKRYQTEAEGIFQKVINDVQFSWFMQLNLFFFRTRFWRWSEDREEYEVVYHDQEEWQVNRPFLRYTCGVES
jgi:hypothetical protein